MKSLLKSILCLLSLAVIFISCKKDIEEEAHTQTGKDSLTVEKHSELIISKVALQQAGITFGEAEMRNIEGKITGSAVLIPKADNEAVLTAPISGIIDRIIVQEGDNVTQGQPLCYIRSIELEGYKSMYFRAQSQLELAKSTLNRQKQLYTTKLISDQEFSEAEAHYRAALAEFKGIDGIILSIGLDRHELGLDEKATTATRSTYALRSPITGTIIHREAIRGAQVDSATTLFHIVRMDQLWAEVQIPSQNINVIKKGSKARIILDNTNGKDLLGTVDQVGMVLNEKTRTLPVRILLDNRDRALRPQMFGTAEIYTEQAAMTLSVPSSAILEEKSGEIKRSYVFLKINDSTFSKKYVMTGIRGSEFTEITEGIEKGVIVATGALFILRSTAEKDRLQDEDMQGMPGM